MSLFQIKPKILFTNSAEGSKVFKQSSWQNVGPRAWHGEDFAGPHELPAHASAQHGRPIQEGGPLLIF